MHKLKCENENCGFNNKSIKKFSNNESFNEALKKQCNNSNSRNPKRLKLI
jgi:hypothetical protein